MKKNKANLESSATSPAAIGIEEMSLTEQVYQRLHEQLVTLKIKPGTMISENQISKALGMGRTPVREAVQRLRQEGLLEIHRSQGIHVPELNLVRQLQLLDVRRQLEPHVSVRAAKHATERQRSRMVELAKEIVAAAKSDSVLDFMHANHAIHVIKIEASNNEILSKTMESFYGLSMRFWYAYYRGTPGSLVDSAGLHANILTAIAAGDAELAAKNTVLLMDFLEKFTHDTLKM